MSSESSKAEAPRRRVKYVPVVGPRLKKLLTVVFALFALLVVNAVYLVSITIAGVQYQNWFYLIMFLLHLALGLLIVVPVIVFGLAHLRNARNRPNRRAIRAGYALLFAACVIFITGFVLMRVDLLGFRFEVNEPTMRSTAYWLHVLVPLIAIWTFILHRLAGRRIRWKVGLTWAAAAAIFAAVCLIFQTQDPRAWNVAGPASGEQYFFPSLTRTSTGDFIPARVLDNNGYCLECHNDVHETWTHSAHRLSSFNNPVYEFSVKQTRRAMMERDGNVQGSRFCAGCHDPVPFLSGAFDDPKFDDPHYDLGNDPSAQAGVTCTVCHSISHVNTVRGNGDYTITEPVQYPFTFSRNPVLKWVNRQLVKAKPEFHKATFLKPLHRTTEYCGTCHKVHLPPELNDYKWLRGQNHFDSFWLSGVSGQGVASFYYPARAETNCNGCHMPLVPVSDAPNFSARVRDDSGLRKTFDHQFPSANTGIVHLLRETLDDPDGAIAAHQAFNEDVMRVDLFGVRIGGTIEGELVAPLRPEVPALHPGETYLIETVVRTAKMGHVFTEGTSDSNQPWLDVVVRSGNEIIGRSGARDPVDGSVDPWAHHVNSFVIDRAGNRIERRNVEDIFVPLYTNQIPPGAADVVHYRLRIPEGAGGPITVEASLRFRKFDTGLMRYVTDDPAYVNDLPIMTLATDTVRFPLSGDGTVPVNDAPAADAWERWNDYGIGLLRKGQLGELRQARHAFGQVEAAGRADGPLNLARVYIKEGLVQTHAPEALRRAGAMETPANEWSLLWFGAQVALRNGDFEKAISNLRDLLRGGFAQAEGRGFDFSRDYRVHVELGGALYQRALQEKGASRETLMREAADAYEQALAYDPENLAAHWGSKQVFQTLGDEEREQHHAAEHARYKPDDNARDYAAGQARIKYPAANRAAEAVVIYDLQRPGTPGLPPEVTEVASQ